MAFGDYVTSQPELTYTAYASSYPMFWHERKLFVFISLKCNKPEIKEHWKAIKMFY